jgi:DNA-binding transcriptional ArsR family regulator
MSTDGETTPPSAERHPALGPAQLKALAHPLRVQILDLLSTHGALTASRLADLVGESSGSTSYHLRQLAAHGFIEEAPELGSARDRWWRASPEGWTLEGIEGFQDPSSQRDAALVLDEFRRSRLEHLERWHRDGHRWGPEWIAASIDMTSRLILSRDEASRLRDELVATVDRWRAEVGARSQGAPRPEDAAAVMVDVDVFPTSEPRTGLAQPTTGAPTSP